MRDRDDDSAGRGKSLGALKQAYGVLMAIVWQRE